ncbi:MAG: DUF1127 domain-containing protein [Pseudomonadota bacterium]
MTATTVTSPRPHLTRASLVRHAGRAVTALFARLKERREISQLLTLDDALLKDIGIDRGDVRAALSTTDGQTAGEHLSAQRRRRAHAQRQAWRHGFKNRR